MGNSGTGDPDKRAFESDADWLEQGLQRLSTAGVDLTETEVSKTKKSLQRLSLALASLGVPAEAAPAWVGPDRLAVAVDAFDSLLKSGR